MSDTLTTNQRSRRMALIRSQDSKPEMLVRRLLHSLGYRYRLHDHCLPGTPDIVFKGRRKVVFVHGCYWHRHVDGRCSSGLRVPKSRADYWIAKFARNVDRDRRNQETLRQSGWDFLIVWECQLKDHESLQSVLQGYLGPTSIER